MLRDFHSDRPLYAVRDLVMLGHQYAAGDAVEWRALGVAEGVVRALYAAFQIDHVYPRAAVKATPAKAKFDAAERTAEAEAPKPSKPSARK